MAGSSDKTEQPTQKRIRDSRKKGQVAKSSEIGSLATFVAVVLCFRGVGDLFVEDLESLMALAAHLEQADLRSVLLATGRTGLTLMLKISFIVVGTAALAALLLNFFQVGPLLAFESVQPKLSNVDPAQKLKKLFSKDSVVQLLKNVIKIIALGTILSVALYHSIPDLFSLPDCELGCILPTTAIVLNHIILYALLVFAVVAVVDLGLARRKYTKDLMMSKEEVKQEYKESEGDPHIKGKRRQLFSEIINSQQVKNVKRSSVVITNPTHLAVGLLYEEDRTPLPIVTFKAEGALARRLVDLARQEGVPVMENVPLARALFEQANVENYIPHDLIKPVAEVLKLLEQLR